jgi:hypothetical protein
VTATDDYFAKEPDWDELSAIGAEAQKLIDSGEWTKDEFDRLYAAGKKASNGHPEFLEGLINEADPDWL